MNAGRVIQINVSAGGVPKTQMAFAELNRLGIVGDTHRYRAHGGPHKAILLLASEVIDRLHAEGFPVFYGALGENFTTRGLDHRLWRSGQVFRVAEILLKLTTPREPCKTLNPFGPGIQKRIYDSRVHSLIASSPHWGESGFYAAVLHGGAIAPEAIIEVVDPVV
jgi:MOSC domain-containing protein YiiM